MSHDVDDPEKGLRPEHVKLEGKAVYSSQKPHILTRIRNFNQLAISSIGSAFSGPFSAMSSYVLQDGPVARGSTDCDTDTWDYAYDLEAGGPYINHLQHQQGSAYDAYCPVETSTPTQTRSNSPLQSSRLADVKRIFNNFARTRYADSHVQMQTINPSLLEKTRNGMGEQHRFEDSSHPLRPFSDAVWEEPTATPPLTPDSFDDLALPSPVVPLDFDDQHDDDESDAAEYNRSHSHSLEIKEGKKPERASANCYDIVTDGSPNTPPPGNGGDDHNNTQSCPSLSAKDDRDEWYGLEYTLELSCRERLPSDTKSAGEHSRSRESWAAIHQGRIHPFFEDEDYYQWKNWHRYLDRQDERRKHKRGWEFKSRSKDLAWLYADEMKTRDVMYWQKEVYGVVGRDVKERLNTLAEHRPDPYSPPKKHGLGWYLKRSRSVACLRELRPLPAPKHRPTIYAYNDTPPEELCLEDESLCLAN